MRRRAASRSAGGRRGRDAPLMRERAVRKTFEMLKEPSEKTEENTTGRGISPRSCVSEIRVVAVFRVERNLRPANG
jgi:retron-type reverse transcriptase